MLVKVTRWKNGIKSTTHVEPIVLIMERAKEAWKNRGFGCASDKLIDGEVAYVNEAWLRLSEVNGELCWLDIFFRILNGKDISK